MKKAIFIIFFLSFLVAASSLHGEETAPTEETNTPQISQIDHEEPVIKKDKIELIPEIDKWKMTVGEPVTFQFALRWKGEGDTYRFRFQPLKTKNLSLLKQFQSSETESGPEGQINSRLYTYVFQPNKSGEAIVDAFTIEYTQKGSSQNFVLDVPAFYLRVQSHPLNLKSLLIVGAVVLVGIVIIAGFLILRKKMKQKPPEPEKIPPENKALNAIDSADVFLRDREIRAFMRKIEAILRDYMYEKYRIIIDASSKEKMDVLAKKKDVLQTEEIRLLESLFTRFQEVQFGGIIPSYNEASTIKNQVHNFIAGKKIK